MIAQKTDELKQEKEKLKQQLQNTQGSTDGSSEKIYNELIKQDQQIKQWQDTVEWIKNWNG